MLIKTARTYNKMIFKTFIKQKGLKKILKNKSNKPVSDLSFLKHIKLFFTNNTIVGNNKNSG